MFEKLCDELSKLPEVTALALGGSRSGQEYDEKSDYDLYVYVSAVPSVERRTEILSRYCSYTEIGNHFWELEDDCTLKNGIDIDIIYRDLDSFAESVARVVEAGNAEMGYTTCMWFNLINSRLIYDEKGFLSDIQKRFYVPYPKALKDNIVKKNFILLHGMLSSYDIQIRKAMERNDMVSVNHRVTAYIQSYFDIIFAINEMMHPGEKRQIIYAVKYAKILPNHFEENINNLYKYLFTDYAKAFEIIHDMYRELAEVLGAIGYEY